MAGEHKINGGMNNSGKYTGTYYHSKQWYRKEIETLTNNYIKPYEQYKEFNAALKDLLGQLNSASSEANSAKKELKDWLTIDGNPIAGNAAGKIASEIKSLSSEVSSLMGYVENRMKNKETYNGKNIYTYKRECQRAQSHAKIYKEGYTG